MDVAGGHPDGEPGNTNREESNTFLRRRSGWNEASALLDYDFADDMKT